MKRSRILAEVHENATALYRSGPKEAAKKLGGALNDPNPRAFLRAIASVVESIGVDRAAQRIGLKPAHLARIIGPKSKPSFEAVHAVVNGLGFRLGIDRSYAPARKRLGLLAGKVRVSADFNAPLPWRTFADSSCALRASAGKAAKRGSKR